MGLEVLAIIQQSTRAGRSAGAARFESGQPRRVHRVGAELGDNIEFATGGLLMLCKTEEAWHEEAKVAEEAHRLGMPAEVLDSQQTKEREPNVRLDVVGSIYYPLDCHLSPSLMMRALQSHLEAMGVQFLWNTLITSVRQEGEQITAVEGADQTFAADEFVLCAGIWSDDLSPGLGLKIPMQAGKGYSLTLNTPPQLPRGPAILMEARVAVTPMGDKLRFGGTMELAGIDTHVNPSRVRGIVKSVPRYFPDFSESHFAAIEPWCGLRPCSPDGLPYLGRSRRIKNLSIATGHGMMGVSLGPVSGRIVADAIDGKESGFDLRLVSPDRFA